MFVVVAMLGHAVVAVNGPSYSCPLCGRSGYSWVVPPELVESSMRSGYTGRSYPKTSVNGTPICRMGIHNCYFTVWYFQQRCGDPGWSFADRHVDAMLYVTCSVYQCLGDRYHLDKFKRVWLTLRDAGALVTIMKFAFPVSDHDARCIRA